MMQILLLLLSCMVFALGTNVPIEEFDIMDRTKAKTTFSYFQEWVKFKNTYGKSYGSMKSEQERFEIFKANLQYMEEHNKLYVLGTKSYYLDINEFSDLTHDEFRRNMNLDLVMENKPQGGLTFQPNSSVKLPDTVDWRAFGYVTTVKNQGSTCGSCWAFSAAGAMEGLYAKKHGIAMSLSAEQLVDCSTSYGNHGCGGGWPSNAFNYIKDHGMVPSVFYPYADGKFPCIQNPTFVVIKCSSYVSVTSGSEADLQNAVATIGPVSVAIDANHTSFQHYKGGVYNEPSCSTVRLTHAVLVVGYATPIPHVPQFDYWLVKNSWGESWGYKGYVGMSRNKNNQCGIATKATYPVM